MGTVRLFRKRGGEGADGRTGPAGPRIGPEFCLSSGLCSNCEQWLISECPEAKGLLG